MKLVSIRGLTLTGLISGMLAVVAILLLTNFGLQILGTVISLMVPGEMELKGIRGSLAGPINIKVLEYRTATWLSRIEDVELDWHPVQLLSGQLQVDAIHARYLLYKQFATIEENPTTTVDQGPPELPMSIDINDLTLDLMELGFADQELIGVQGIRFQGSTSDQRLNIDNLHLSAASFSLDLNGHLGLAENEPISLQVSGMVNLLDLGTINHVGSIEGELENLEFSSRIRGSIEAKLDGRLTNLLRMPELVMDISAQAGSSEALSYGLPGTDVNLQWSSIGNIDQLTASAEVQINDAAIGSSALTAQLAITGEQISITEMVIQNNEIGGVTGTADINTRTLIQKSKWRWDQLQWRFGDDSVVSSHNGLLSTSGTVEDYQLLLAGSITHNGSDTADVNLVARGDWTHLELTDIDVIESELVGKLSGSIEYYFDDQRVNAEFSWQDLLAQAQIAAGIFSRTGNLTITGVYPDYLAAANGVLGMNDWGSVSFDVDGYLSPDQISLRSARLNELDGTGELNMQLNYSLVNEQFKLSGQWRDAKLPAASNADLQSPSGNFRVTGRPADYSVGLQGILSGPGGAAGSLNITGTGKTDQLNISRLSLEILEGTVDGQVTIGWSDALTWQAEIRAAELKPELVLPTRKGRVALRASSEGQALDGTLNAFIKIHDVQGDVGNHPLMGHGHIQVNDNRISVRESLLQIGDASIAVQGDIIDQVNLLWRLSVPDINQVITGASGAITGSGQLGGIISAPVVKVDLEARQLALNETTLDSLVIHGDLDLQQGTITRLQVRGEDVSYAGYHLQRVFVDVGGATDQHGLKVHSTGDLNLDLAATGNWQNQAWSGRVESITMSSDPLSKWHLESPFNVTASRAMVEISPFCLNAPSGALCASGDWTEPGGLTLRGKLSDVNANKLLSLLPVDLKLDARINADVEIHRTPTGPITGFLSLDMQQGRLGFSHQGESIDLPITLGTVKSSSDGSAGQFELALDFGEVGNLQADLQFSDLINNPQISGRVLSHYNEQGLLEFLIPEIEAATGVLDVDIVLSDSLVSPTVAGTVSFSNGTASLPFAGLDLRDADLTLRGIERDALEVSGGLTSDTGRLQLRGKLKFKDLKPVLDLSLRGQDIMFSNTADLQGWVSPDLQIKSQDGTSRLTGTVQIPKLVIQPASFSSTARASPDIRMINQEPVEKSVLDSRLDADVLVTLGEDVRLNLPGFQSLIRGEVRIIQPPDLLPYANGSLQVINGSYAIYGQQLEIERGLILYTGGPLNDPGLDLRVSRKIGDITAGALVSDRLKTPKIQLYSSPVLPETSIVSYLLFGRPPDSKSGTDASLLLNAALSLGGSDRYIGRDFQRSIGLDTLEFSGNDQSSSLEIGKYLSPELYVSYGVGLFDAINTFMVRYDIAPGLAFETRTSSVRTSTDLIYTFER